MRQFLENHVFANLSFALVLIVGFLAYGLMPRQKDPDMNFNWISIVTLLPAATAEDVERLVTDPLEQGLEKVSDIRFVASKSREGVSSILVRFQEMDERTFDRRIADLRRELRNKEAELPKEAEEPVILEITSANGFPTAVVAVQGEEEDENLRNQARRIKRDLERLKGADQILKIGLADPEIQVRLLPERLPALGVTPDMVADTVAARFRDLSGGALHVGEESWLVRLAGVTADPDELARWSIAGLEGEVTLDRLARVVRGREKAEDLALVDGKPAVLLTVTKQARANALELTDRLRDYLAEQNTLYATTGVRLVLVDDQTHPVRQAIHVMESNALFGLVMVFLTSWLFLGSRIALLVSVGVPFALAGTFAVLFFMGETLNVMVLLGVVIALGMLVDDAVVIVESIAGRLQQGMETTEAVISGVREVFAPVLSSVLTTVAAFLPLMLLPGILGKFMRVIPLVVTLGLLISLVEAFWMMPAHILALRPDLSESGSRLQPWRLKFLKKLRYVYTRLLLRVVRRPRLSLALFLAPLGVALFFVASGVLRLDFFAADPFPVFYVNIEMAGSSTLRHTLATTRQVEQRAMTVLQAGELRQSALYAGQMMTETEPLFGKRFGQIMVSLEPDEAKRRPVEAIIADMRRAVAGMAGPESINFLKLAGGPPVTKPISIKVRGDDYATIRPAVAALKQLLGRMPEVSDIDDDYAHGLGEMTLRLDDDATRRAGIHPSRVARIVRLLGDGEIVAEFQHQGEKVAVRVMAEERGLQSLDEVLAVPVAVRRGESIPLGGLTHPQVGRGMETIQHYNYRRTVSVEAELDKTRLDIVAANALVRREWGKMAHQFPGVNLDFSGILDDIEESMDHIATLFVFGVGVMAMILGAQFVSYGQPLLILITVPIAFTGVVFGLLLAGHPLSLYTLYGVVALSGIAVNSAIVLISAANDRVAMGMSRLHAAVFAARRRLVPILITSLTTMAGLISLATGLAGQSLMWGPVATAIVWGLGFSTALTLFLMPLLYIVVTRKA